MTDISARLADLKRREDEEITERARLIRALNKAITLILTLAAVGVLTFGAEAMSDYPCVIKEFGGCACKDGECAETRATPAPVVLISLKTQAIVCLFLGFVAMIGSAAWMETRLKTADRTDQEVSHVAR